MTLALASASELSRLIARREVSALELAEDFLARYERFNPRLNAIVAIDADAARTNAKATDARAAKGELLGPLDGIPITVKDNIFVAGFRATWGSRLFADFVPPCDDISIGRLRAAGANLLAKTNTPEFALASHTDNLVFGATRNPWNLELTPGGSSGGAVAALAAGLGALAVGTDAGGSIRRPASHAGVVGLRPSTGRIARAFGFPPLADDFQVIAPAARTVEDLYLLLRTMAGPDARDRASLALADYPLPPQLTDVPLPRLRIRYLPRIGDALIDAQVYEHVAAAAKLLAGMRHDVDEGPAPFDLAHVEEVWSTMSSVGLARVLATKSDWTGSVHPASRAIAERGMKISGIEYARALDLVRALRLKFAESFRDFDCLLTPTSAALPWPLGKAYPERINDREASPRAAALFATFVNAGGLPAISVPVAPAAGGIPIGMQLVGAFGADALLLRLASAFEDAAPWPRCAPGFE